MGSAYRSQYSISGRLFGFDSVDVDRDLQRQSFIATFTRDQGPFCRGATVSGRFAVGAGVVITLALLLREEPA